jgi:hypothetical protein
LSKSVPTIDIDTALLPWVAMLDTNVVLRALAEQQDDRAPACKAFWDAMLAERRQMLIAAPTRTARSGDAVRPAIVLSEVRRLDCR